MISQTSFLILLVITEMKKTAFTIMHYSRKSRRRSLWYSNMSLLDSTCNERVYYLISGLFIGILSFKAYFI